jgi:ABC-type cobalt transport system substrate-binding protein
MKQIACKYLPLIILIILAILLTTISFLSDGYYAGADNISHYQISRYSFQHPYLFFSLWGRPLYSILASPFAQYGFYWIKMFNVIVALLTAWYSYKTVRALNYPSPWLVMVFIVFAPMYFVMIFTGLTEPLFGLVLVLSIFMFFREKYILSAILISLIPFARMEGVVLMPLFFMALLFKKQWKAIPFMAFGFLLLTLAGGIYSGNYLWIIENYPVSGNHPVYFKYSGPWYHFIRNYDIILGLPLTILLLVGMIYLFLRMFYGSERRNVFFQVLLIAGSMMVYLGFHSYLYWTGKGGSIGLLRVLVGVIPLAGIIALAGYQWLDQTFINKTWQRVMVQLILVIVIVRIAFGTNEIPVRLGVEESQERKMAEWVQGQGLDKEYFYLTDPNAWFFLDKDPYDGSTSALLDNLNSRTPMFEKINNMKAGSVIAWDAHFGANERQLPIDTLMTHPRLKLIFYTRPEQSWITFGNQEYAVYVFRVLPAFDSIDNYAARDSISAMRLASMTKKMVVFKDYETLPSSGKQPGLSESNPFSGSYSCMVDSTLEFCSGISTEIGKLTPLEGGFYFEVSAEVFPTVPFSENSAWLVVTLDHNKKNYLYEALRLENEKLVTGQWNHVIFQAYIPEIKSGDDHFGVYFWNRALKKFYIDNFKIALLTPVKQY